MRKTPEVVQATRSCGRRLGLEGLGQVENEHEGDQTNRNSCYTDPLGRRVCLSRDRDQRMRKTLTTCAGDIVPFGPSQAFKTSCSSLVGGL